MAGTLLAIVAILASGCSSTPIAKETVDAQRAVQQRTSKEDLNRKLAAMAVRNAASGEVLQREYQVGTGDVLDISVFGVDELNKTARVNAKGAIVLPLLGEVSVGGKTLREIEDLLVKRLKHYMHDPQVSVYVSDYQSQQVSVTGAVNDPSLHTLTRPRTVLELLSMSGGLSPNAGKKIYVQTTVDGQPQRLIIDLDEVLNNPTDTSFALLLKGGDSIFVPEAGTVFVEGAVKKPGAYQLKGDTGVLEAIAMAGGAEFAARQSKVQVITLAGNGGQGKEVVAVDLDKLRANESPNVVLKDGDIVLVPTNTVKAGFAGFWHGLAGIFGVGYSVNGP
jgi:polysaccharide export outer membrane protein